MKTAGKKPSAPVQSRNAFIGKTQPPTEQELATALGKMKPVWDRLVAELDTKEFGVHEQQWNSYSPKAGWSLKLKRGQRTIMYLVPLNESFRVAVILGQKAVVSANASDLPEWVKRTIQESPKYPEGTGVRIELRSQKELPALLKLARIKLDN